MYKISIGCELVCADDTTGPGSDLFHAIDDTFGTNFDNPIGGDGESTATSVPAEEPATCPQVWVCPESNTTLEGFFDGTIEGEGHSFNIVVYKNRYRIMDYYPLGTDINTYDTSKDPMSDSHRASNLWNDKIGKFWAIPWSADWTNPGEHVQNVKVGGENCYETGKDHWSSRTLYSDICE